MITKFLGKYGVARHLYVPITKRAVIDFAVGADWTPVAGDVKVSKDGGAAANIGTLPAVIVMGNGAMWDFTLTATEMQAAQVMVTVADAATKAVEDQALIVETYGHASALHEFDLDTPTVNPGAAGITSAAFAAGAIDAGAIATDAFGALEVAAGAASEIATAVWAVAMSELAGVPGPTDSVLEGLEWLFALARNRLTQTASQTRVFLDDGSTLLGAAATSDAGGTLVRGEFA